MNFKGLFYGVSVLQFPFFQNSHWKVGHYLVNHKIAHIRFSFTNRIFVSSIELNLKFKFGSNFMLWEVYVLDTSFTFLSVFLSWSEWSSCSLTCGSGEQTRTGRCDRNCDGVQNDDLSETQICNDVDCPGKNWCMRGKAILIWIRT